LNDWLLERSIPEMAAAVFAGTFVVTGLVYWLVTRLAVGERGKSFKALSPGMLPPLGIIFGLLVGFTAAQVWSDFERAKTAVAAEASSLRSIRLYMASLSSEQQAQFRALISAHVSAAVNQEWPDMAQRRATLAKPSAALIEALEVALALAPKNDSQKLAQQKIIAQLEAALDARRQRIIISQSTVTRLKWAGLLLQGLAALIAIAMVHSDNKLTCAIALTLFSAGIAISILLIAAYSRPFTGEVGIKPYLLEQLGHMYASP
jgi:hypothetical protein